jgi:hypothetical protein
MLNEFDIFLSKRITECDIIVYSLPYRDGLTATNRMILDSCIHSYTLHKLVAVQTGFKLVSHIDDMLKRCYEMLECETTLDVSAEFKIRYPFYIVPNIIELSTPDIALIATAFEEAKNAMQLVAAPLLASVGKSLGSGNSYLLVGANLSNTLKQGFVTATDCVSLGANVEGTHGRGYEAVNFALTPSAELTDLYYCITNTARTVTEISALVLGTEFHYSLGRGYSGVALKATASGSLAQKFTAAQSTLDILSSLTAIIAKVIKPDDSAMMFTADASMIIKRKRLLSDMDESELVSFDDMTLGEIDFVIL